MLGVEYCTSAMDLLLRMFFIIMIRKGFHALMRVVIRKNKIVYEKYKKTGPKIEPWDTPI